MTFAEMTLEELRRRGIDALTRELGPVGMIRFLQQFETGAGDYSRDRDQWLPDDVQAIMEVFVRPQGGAKRGRSLS
jgi:hypothetical protein